MRCCCTFCYFQRAKVRIMRKLTKYGVDFLVRSEERGVACGTGGSWDVADVGGFRGFCVLFCFTQRRKGRRVFYYQLITHTLIFLVIRVIRGDI